MRTIGLLGGMSWESTCSYYKIINEEVRNRLGALHSAKLVLYSLDFADISELQHRGDWDGATKELIHGAERLSAAGADCLVICTNTMHKVADAVSSAIRIPLLHIADATAQRLNKYKISKVGLLGTRFTMEQDFYRNRLIDKGLEVVIPKEASREIVHKIIYEELCKGQIISNSREQYRSVIKDLIIDGVEGVILGCTEIGMLVDQSDSDVPLFDTTRIHAEAAVEFALKDILQK